VIHFSYALIEYEDFKDASEALKGMNGAEIYGKEVSVDWAFKKPNKKANKPK
jgi:RNA recognition motif-containing protein